MGQTTLTIFTATYKEYKETLIDVIDDLIRHSYITKCQAQYLRMTKGTLGGNKVIVIGNFYIELEDC